MRLDSGMEGVRKGGKSHTPVVTSRKTLLDPILSVSICFEYVPGLQV
jgi:hypothetical protein